MLRKSFSPYLPWLCWGIGSLFVAFQFLLQTSASVMIAELQHDFAIDIFGVSLLSSSFFYTYLIFQIPAGIIVDRYGARTALIGGLLLSALACFLFANAHSLQTAVISRVLLGLASAPSVVCALSLAAKWFGGRYFALLAGSVEMIGMLGGALGQAGMARFIHHFGWRSTLFGCAAAALILAIIAFLMVQDSPEIGAPQSSTTPTKNWQNLLKIIQLPQAWMNGLFCGLSFAVLAAFSGFWCVPYLMQLYSLPLHTAADISCFAFVGTALGTTSLGWLSDHVGGHRRLLTITVTGIILCILLAILYVPPISLNLMGVLIFLLGFSSGIYVLSFAVMRDITHPDMRGTAMGYTNMMCIGLGSPILQPLIGWILDQQPHTTANFYSVSQYQHALIILPICLIIAIGLIAHPRAMNTAPLP